jgi:hypothetical protein
VVVYPVKELRIVNRYIVSIWLEEVVLYIGTFCCCKVVVHGIIRLRAIYHPVGVVKALPENLTHSVRPVSRVGRPCRVCVGILVKDLLDIVGIGDITSDRVELASEL